MSEIPNKIRTVLSASGIGWYGPDPEIPNPRPFIESDPSYHDFLGNTCRSWEESIQRSATLGKRVVTFRTGIILSKKGGALKRFRIPVWFGFATILGKGSQLVSWIHIEDLARMYIMAISQDSMSGIYNAVAPGPVSNRDFILTLARVKRKFWIPMKVPSFVLKTVLGEMSIEVLKSATVSSAKIREHGFVFQFSTLEKALENTESKDTRQS